MDLTTCSDKELMTFIALYTPAPFSAVPSMDPAFLADCQAEWRVRHA